jgi:hypothetical protein
MSNLTMSLTATRWGAALPGARMPQAMFETLGQAGMLRPSYGSPLPATSSVAVGAAAGTGMACVVGGTEASAGIRLAATPRIPASNGRPADNRKQQYVHKTRVNAGGDGASGPEPEREQALQKVRPGRSPSGRGPAKPGSAA